MLRITVELVPHGKEENKEKISVLEIVNSGSKNEYNEFKYFAQGWWKELESQEIRKINKIAVDFDRREFLWKLIYRVCIKIIKPFGGYTLRKKE